MAKQKRSADFGLFKPKNIFNFVFTEERRSGVLLIVAALTALIIANTGYSEVYFNWLGKYFTLGGVHLNISHWIGDGLMALFFLAVGLEVKRELIDGELRSWKKASFPIIAAIGGMLLPAFLFSLLNPYLPQSNGWAIPMATDVAIAVGAIGLLGKRIPRPLRVFLLTLAIVDDIGSILVIGLFYNHPTNMLALISAVIVCIAMAVLRNKKHWPSYFLVLGITLWYLMLNAGVSATMSGVLIAFLMPLYTRSKKMKKLQSSEVIEDILVPIASFFVVPLFVFANAGFQFSNVAKLDGASVPVFVGILLGLFVGKPVGILLAGWLGQTLKLSRKPAGSTWGQIAGIGYLAGIGFTVSLLVANLAYRNEIALLNAATFGIFAASVLSGVVGIMVLRATSNSRA